jgi:hypothetical protein
MPGKGKSEDSRGKPPGWSKGMKSGWQGADMTPSQARKAGSHVEDEMLSGTTQTQRTEQEPITSDQS